MSDTLDKIVADKRRHVAGRMSQRPLRVVENLARDTDSPRGFSQPRDARVGAHPQSRVARRCHLSPPLFLQTERNPTRPRLNSTNNWCGMPLNNLAVSAENCSKHFFLRLVNQVIQRLASDLACVLAQ